MGTWQGLCGDGNRALPNIRPLPERSNFGGHALQATGASEPRAPQGMSFVGVLRRTLCRHRHHDVAVYSGLPHRGLRGGETQCVDWRNNLAARMAHADPAWRMLGDHRLLGGQPAPGAGAGRTAADAKPPPAAGAASPVVMAGAAVDPGQATR